jgi:tRNA 2-selenouridine synthase
MVRKIDIEKLLTSDLPVIDVRSPVEYARGHIPGAINIPVFSDEERVEVGRSYKQQSQEDAVRLGHQYVKPKLHQFVTDAFAVAPDGNVIVHCWRGGQRSSAFANHLSDNRFKEVMVLDGGYKSFRSYVLECFEVPLKILVLGGYTGSGKTHILHEMQKQGEQVIDLEALAIHRGSVFGGIGQEAQPAVEQFENNLFTQLRQLDTNRFIWLEDESHQIGKAHIPDSFFRQMRNANLVFLEIPREVRAKLLVEEYAQLGDAHLMEGVQGISKRLGGLRTKEILGFLDAGDYFTVALLTLEYYDKAYLSGSQKRPDSTIFFLKMDTTNHKQNAVEILAFSQALMTA